MDTYEIQKIIEKKYETLNSNLEILFESLGSISGTIETIRELNQVLNKLQKFRPQKSTLNKP